MTSIKLFRGAFGHVSVLNVASDFVTHAHLEAHMIIWLGGTAGEMTIGGDTVALGPRIAAGINALQPHSHSLLGGGEPGLFLAFYINPDWVNHRRGDSAGAPMFANPAIPIDGWLHQAAASLLERLCADEDLDDLIDYEIERLIDSIVDAAEDARPKRSRLLNGFYLPQDFRVAKAVAFMRANICERINLDDVARSVGLSRPHFFALFKEQTNLTPNVYWNTLRMDEAQRQLQSSPEPLISVACNLGFTSPGNFSRFFRDHVGVPPIQYREAARLPH